MAISYLAAFGLLVLLFQDAAGDGGLNYFLPFLMFVFLLALGHWNWWPTTYGTPAQATPDPDAAPASVFPRLPSPPRS